MKITREDLIPILYQFNPWWKGEDIPDLPPWRRAVFPELYAWIENPPVHRAILLSGARQVGKTTLLLQTIQTLLKRNVSPSNILYATFDHPIIKLVGIDEVLKAWRERETKREGVEYLFLDEAQFIRDWGTWVKHQVDFNKQRRLIFTGSAMPLIEMEQESGVGRWHTIRLTTLSFYEYLNLKRVELPILPKISSLLSLFSWPESDFYKYGEAIKPYVPHFYEYLIRGGFPQTALIENITQAQRLLREDIIDKVLKRDMTALFGVRRVLELESTFLYLCMHDGGLLDIPDLCKNLSVKRPTAQHYIDLLEVTHLIYRLPPFGYGKGILRGRFKIYLADAAISPAVLLKGKEVLNDSTALGFLIETCVFKHLFARYYASNIRFTYWRDKKGKEVDLVAETKGEIIPFEIKYRQQHTESKDLEGLIEFCRGKNINRAYVVTKSLDDFGLMKNTPDSTLLKIPAPLLCYWMGEAEQSINHFFDQIEAK